MRIFNGRLGLEVNYHFLHDQYLALVFGPGLAQLCLALNDFLAFGFDFLIFMVFCPARLAELPPCPKLTFLTLPVLGSFTYTLNFFTSPRIGLLSGTFLPWYSASNSSVSSSGKPNGPNTSSKSSSSSMSNSSPSGIGVYSCSSNATKASSALVSDCIADFLASSSTESLSILSLIAEMSNSIFVNSIFSSSANSFISFVGTLMPSILFMIFLISIIDSAIGELPICICVLSFVNCVVFANPLLPALAGDWICLPADTCPVSVIDTLASMYDP